MNYSKEIIWGRYALNNKKISRTQLQKCVEEQGSLREKGIEKSLVDIFVDKGYISRQNAAQVRLLKGMLPGYDILEELGSGGLGVVYKAYSEKNDREVAIKILNPEFTDNAIVLGRFLREIDISKSLDHPNIVKGIDSGRVEDLYYLVLEYIDGGSVTKYVTKDRPAKEKNIIGIAAGVTNALYYAWKKGLTHRDIKPENIMFTKSGTVKICDFGLAKLVDANVALTLSGTIVGSPYYISPEQAKGAIDLDYRSDIYSLGATLYFLATGRTLFDEKTLIAICNAHVNVTPLSPSTYVQISPSLEQMILKMLSKEPADRCGSPEDFVTYLNSVLREFKEKFPQGDQTQVVPISREKPEPTARHLTEVSEMLTENLSGNALLIDPNDLSRKILREELEKYGFEVLTTENAKRALDIYAEHLPKLLVVSTAPEGKMDIWGFFTELKANVNLVHKCHYIILEEKKGDVKTRMRATILGIKHFISRPIELEEVRRILDYIKERQGRETTKIGLPKLKGNLSLMSLPELLQTLYSSEKTGVLTVQEIKQKGMIYIEKKKILHCELGGLSSKASLVDMLSWQRGTFIFQELVHIEKEATLDADIQGIIFDGMRILDELGRLEEKFGKENKKDFELFRLAVLEEWTSSQDIIDFYEDFLEKAPEMTFREFLIEHDVADAKFIETLENLLTEKKRHKGKDIKKDQTVTLTKGGRIIDKKQSSPVENVNTNTTNSGSSSSINAKDRIEDTILQHLLLSRNVMDMSQFSECISIQVELQLQGNVHKSLGDIIVEENYVEKNYIQNLKFFRDEEGQSLIPGYEIVKVIGEGGIAIVYLGRNIETNETVAIKIFAPGTSDTSSTIARFMREAEAAKKLNHPNIVKASDFGTIHGVYYLVMEYVPGLSLSQIISRMGRLTEEKALGILDQLANALAYAWGKGIIHRDIKPGNILSDGDILKICDLGLAKALGSGIELTQEGTLVGTPQFMSPEQFQPEKELDFRTDIYSLGVTFYVMLTGRLPFTANTKMGLAQAHMSQAPAPLKELNLQISKQTRALMMKMLEKDREKRCQEINEIPEDVKRVRNGKYPKNYRISDSNLKKYIAIGAGALVVIIALLIFVLSGDSEKKIEKDIASLISENRYKEAKQVIENSSLEEKDKKRLLEQVNETEEIASLIAEKEFEKAKKKLLDSGMSEKEQEKWTGIIAEESRKIVKILEMSPGDGSRIYEEKVEFRGTIQAGELDYILLQDMRTTTTKISDSTWHFTVNIPLKTGRNSLVLTIVPVKGDRVDKKFTIWREQLDTQPPVVTLTMPENVERGKKYLYTREVLALKGYVTDNEKVASISINKTPVPTLISGEKTLFEYRLNLKEGTQKIIITAKDERGNEGEYSFRGYLKPKGWFGEKMPKGMSKGGKRGEYIWNKDGSIMVYVPEGEFWWGEKKKARKIYMSAYYIDKYEVTWKLYLKYCKAKKKRVPKSPSWGVKNAHPVVNVSYKRVRSYAKWIGKAIPTAAQWKKAARGGVDIPDWKSTNRYVTLMKNPIPFRLYVWGDEEPNAKVNGEKVYRCNYCADDSFVGQAYDGYMYTGRTGDFPQWSSPYQCCDMIGNVFEMCRDWYSKGYMPANGEVDPKGPLKPSKAFRVKMGGGFHSLAKKCVIDYQEKLSERRSESQTGVRLVIKAKK